MKEVILKLNEIFDKLKVIELKVNQKEKGISSPFLDNQEFIQLMNISKRTAQEWRDSGIVSFSQIGHKIYYRSVDIEELLNLNYFKRFNKLK